MKNPYHHRLRLVESARQRGIQPTARWFATTVRTVRKWLRRYQECGPAGLLEHPRAPHHQPRQTPPTHDESASDKEQNPGNNALCRSVGARVK